MSCLLCAAQLLGSHGYEAYFCACLAPQNLSTETPWHVLPRPRTDDAPLPAVD